MEIGNLGDSLYPKSKNVSRIRKKTLEGDQKSIFSTSKLKKKPKLHKGSVRKNLQAHLKIKKNYRNTKSTNQN
jgi:hypothetical protein